MRILLLSLLVVLFLAGCATTAKGERLRGDYTLGHEVNIFCPQPGAQCYWLGPNSSRAARERLREIYRGENPGLYKPVCVLVDGLIDRSSGRDGFAADYDGLIDIETVVGPCPE